MVVNDKVYAGSADGKVYALNTATGNVAWTYTTGGPVKGSPTYSNGVIYIASTDSYLYALNAVNGGFLWKSFSLAMSQSIGTTARVEFYNDGTPTVAAGKVFIGGGIQYANPITGVNYTAMNMSTPAAANGGGIRFFAFDAATGASIWNISRAGNTQPFYAPAYVNGQLYAPEFFEITAMSATNPGAGKYLPPDFIYTQRINGNRTVGQWLGYQITGSIAYADDLTGGKIYAGSDIGSIYCLNATDMSTLSVFTAGGNAASSPAIWDGKLYCGTTEGRVYCFDDSPKVDFSLHAAADKGGSMWNNETINIGGRLTSNPNMAVWDYNSHSYTPEASQYHPGLPNATVQISLTKPDGTSLNLTAISNKTGYFQVSYTPTELGDWGWVAYYEGMRADGLQYNSANSQWTPITVLAAPVEPTAAPTATASPTPIPATPTPTAAPTPTPTSTPAPFGSSSTDMLIIVAIVVIIVVVAVAAYMASKRKKKPKA
jgi:outer membrane protein assembly factor BamB